MGSLGCPASHYTAPASLLQSWFLRRRSLETLAQSYGPFCLRADLLRTAVKAVGLRPIANKLST